MVSHLPVWMLDVDGVLNVSEPAWHGPVHTGHADAYSVAYPMTWSPSLVESIIEIHESGEVEIRWATTWVDLASEVERLMGLPSFPLAFHGLHGPPQLKAGGAKMHAALVTLYVEGRPLVWTDDDAIPADGTHARMLANSAPRRLFISPNHRHGLTPGNVADIRRFIADPQGWPSHV